MGEELLMKELLIQTNSKEYPLYIGVDIIPNCLEIFHRWERNPSTILVITDDKVGPFYIDDLTRSLQKYAPVHIKIIKNGEESKSFQSFFDCHSYALEKGLDRHSVIIAFGGGVVGDLAGFVAATFMRGIRFVQIPTTLLAHDSAVGGKVAINHPLSKNAIGSFYQPDAVLYDLKYLKSLPNSEWRAGFAELIKHSLILDKEFYPWLRQNVPNLNEINNEVLMQALLRGISVKASIVKEDETESGIRAHLNFGHTLAHALEAELGYGNISHGDAVAIGMIFAMEVSERVLSVTLPINEIKQWFKHIGYPNFPNFLSSNAVIERMKKDKKSVKGNIRMVLLKDIADIVITEVEDNLLLEILQQFQDRGEN
jgi:3-dehydroquinate synthase